MHVAPKILCVIKDDQVWCMLIQRRPRFVHVGHVTCTYHEQWLVFVHVAPKILCVVKGDHVWFMMALWSSLISKQTKFFCMWAMLHLYIIVMTCICACRNSNTMCCKRRPRMMHVGPCVPSTHIVSEGRPGLDHVLAGVICGYEETRFGSCLKN